MPEPVNASVLRRKLSAPGKPAEQPNTPLEGALNLAIVRATEALVQLEMEVSVFAEERISLDEIVQVLETPYLIQKTKNAGGTLGLALWSAGAVSALTEHMITGRLSSAPPGSHLPTATDAAIIQDLLNRILTVFDQGLAEVPDPPRIRVIGLLVFSLMGAPFQWCSTKWRIDR